MTPPSGYPPDGAAARPGETAPPRETVPPGDAVTAMLEARSVAVVGASARAGSLGARMLAELAASPSRPVLYPVNPRYPEVGGLPCYATLDAVPGPVDLVLLGVPDAALEDQLTVAAQRGDRSAVLFGGAYDAPGQPPGLRTRLAAIATEAGMALCGAGCMGFVNLTRGLRAVGYVEPDPLPAGPVALITHSGSVFSTLLRCRRGFGFTLAVSSGQELVTSAAAYARYALAQPETRILALVLEAIRDAAALRSVLAGAAAADIPVVLLTAGGSPRGRSLVTAHSGALAAADGAWEALTTAYGLHRVTDLAELADTLELFTHAYAHRPRPPAPRPGSPVPGPDGRSVSVSTAWPGGGEVAGAAGGPGGGVAGMGGVVGGGLAGDELPAGCGIATVHDSGLERAHVADLAERLGVPFAAIGPRTRQRLAAMLDPGLEPGNPLDMWGTGHEPQAQLTESLAAMAADPAVLAVALAVDLVPEPDGDQSYPQALLAAAVRTSKPVAALAGLPAAVDPVAAAELRAAGVPVLEGTRSGLLALRHLLDHLARAHPLTTSPPAGLAAGRAADRGERWRGRLARGELDAVESAELLRDYGVPVAAVRAAGTAAEVLAAAEAVGYPVVLKTGEPGVAHKSDVGGVVLGLAGPGELAAAYRGLAARLGPRALVCQTAAPGAEILVGIVTDPALGPLLVLGAGGVLAELFADRVVALPPVDRRGALAMLRRLRVFPRLAGTRGQPAANLDSVAGAIASLSVLAVDLAGGFIALDVNPLVCSPVSAIAVDVLIVH